MWQNSNCDKTRELKFWKLKNSSCDKNSNCDATQIVMKFKNSNGEWTQNWETQILTNLKMCRKKLKMWPNSNCGRTQNSNYDKTQKLKLWQNTETQIVTQLEIWLISGYEEKNFKGSFSKNILTPSQVMRCSLGSVLQFLRCCLKNKKKTCFCYTMLCSNSRSLYARKSSSEFYQSVSWKAHQNQWWDKIWGPKSYFSPRL